MFEGYKDGLDPNSPPPSANRSHSYRHGFQNGRNDLAGKAPTPAEVLRKRAATAIAMDESA